jgi:hypothetical protein
MFRACLMARVSGAGAWCKHRSAAAAQSCRARPQIPAAALRRGKESRRSSRCRTCTPSCGGRTCRVRRDRRRAGLHRAGQSSDRSRSPRGPDEACGVGAASAVAGAFAWVSSDIVFPLCSLCSGTPENLFEGSGFRDQGSEKRLRSCDPAVLVPYPCPYSLLLRAGLHRLCRLGRASAAGAATAGSRCAAQAQARCHLAAHAASRPSPWPGASLPRPCAR